ncbi:MAG: hypothetical protein RIM72_01305 [Alphaproteobacteria bacterium]
MMRKAAWVAFLMFAAACQQTGADKASPTVDAATTEQAAAETAEADASAEAVAQNIEADASDPPEEAIIEDIAKTQEAAVTVEPIVYEESFTFDWDMSQKLRQADGSEVVLLTPEGVSLTEIPEQLDRWLSRVKENGGYVKAAPVVKQDDERSRAIVGALIDVFLYLLGIIKEEVTFSPADDYNAILYFEKDTGVVEQIVFFPKT